MTGFSVDSHSCSHVKIHRLTTLRFVILREALGRALHLPFDYFLELSNKPSTDLQYELEVADSRGNCQPNVQLLVLS